MVKIPLEVLDEYAKKLSNTQVNKLYENKMNKAYTKPLREVQEKEMLSLYLDAYTIAEELDANKSELIMGLNERFSNVMKNVTYRIDEDAILFSAKTRTDYSNLIQSLLSLGIDGNTLEQLKDKKY